jgi:hypothetical protein
MARSDYILAVLLSVAYVVLISFATGISATWGDFISSGDFWGQSNATAIAYTQIYHAMGVGLAALPIGLSIAWRYRMNWRRPAVIIAIIGSSGMLFDQLRGMWLLSQNGLPLEIPYMVSGAIDVLKVGLILLLVTAILRRVFVPERAPA